MADLRMGRTARALALGLLALSSACTPLDDALVAIFGRSMRSQRSFDPYENTRPPAEGAVSFSSANFPGGPFEVNLGEPEALPDEPPPFTIQDLAQRTDVIEGLQNPVPPTDQSLARGEELYNRVCAVCHGPDGIGANALILEVHPVLAAYNLALQPAAGYSDGYLYAMIRIGRGLMPSYGYAISHFDRWHIVNYLRSLQAQAAQGDGQE